MKLLTEFVGTFLFLFVIALVVPTGGPLIPLAIGGALMVMVYMGGQWSGGMYNPAVALGVCLRGKMTASEMVQYWVVQFVAGILAFWLGAFVTGATVIVAPGAGVTPVAALIVETIFTLMLVLVVLNVATTKASENKGYYGLAIGFTIVVAAAAGGGISGGAFNPAVGIGSNVAALLRGEGSTSHLWIYLVGPLLGGVLAALIFRMQVKAEAA